MNPLIAGFLTRLFQLALAVGAGWFVRKGWFTDAEMSGYVTAGVAGLVALTWALWEKYKDRLKFMTAAASTRPVSETEVEQMVKAGQAPPTTLDKSRVPYLEGSPKVRNDGPDPNQPTPNPPAA
jgi:hypothetical protein